MVWPRFPEAVRSRIIGYVWDTTEPAGTICKSEKTGTVTYVVVRSGTADLGKWLTERRNVVEDFKKIYGDEPRAVRRGLGRHRLQRHQLHGGVVHGSDLLQATVSSAFRGCVDFQQLVRGTALAPCR